MENKGLRTEYPVYIFPAPVTLGSKYETFFMSINATFSLWKYDPITFQ